MASPKDGVGPRSELAERLERGGVEYYPVCPFAAPTGEDLQLLMQQRLGGRTHKNISYDPQMGRLGGYQRRLATDLEKLRAVLIKFSQTATAWLGETLPEYAKQWRLDRVSFRPEEEATRKLRHKARNDLLHVDSFPSRPTNGWRILRLFVNINPTEPRIWCTSDPFARLLERFGREVGLPSSHHPSWGSRLRDGVIRLFQPNQPQRSAYDAFMLRFHDFLKVHDEFQEVGPKRYWSFAAGSAWLCLTDTCSHAVLRGRYALEHSYFVCPETLALPEESPPELLKRACGISTLLQAA